MGTRKGYTLGSRVWNPLDWVCGPLGGPVFGSVWSCMVTPEGNSRKNGGKKTKDQKVPREFTKG